MKFNSAVPHQPSPAEAGTPNPAALFDYEISGLNHPDLHGVNDLVAGGDGADDDDGVAFSEEAFFQQGFQGQFDVFVQIFLVKFDDQGKDAVIQRQMPRGFRVFADGVNHGM